MVCLQRLESVLAQTGQSRSQHYADVKAGLMVAPVKISLRAAAWPAAEVDAVIRGRVSGMTDDDLRRLVDKLHAARKALAPSLATETEA